jgi:hypothetical protein
LVPDKKVGFWSEIEEGTYNYVGCGKNCWDREASFS